MFDVFHVNEIHSSFFDVWFSYGIIPAAVLVYWIVRNVIRCDRAQRAAVLALLAESFTLMNCRQSFFWFLIVMAGMSGPGKCVWMKERLRSKNSAVLFYKVTCFAGIAIFIE